MSGKQDVMRQKARLKMQCQDPGSHITILFHKLIQLTNLRDTEVKLIPMEKEVDKEGSHLKIVKNRRKIRPQLSQ
jgi:hypothetical protein